MSLSYPPLALWRRTIFGAAAILLTSAAVAQASGSLVNRAVAPTFLKGINVFIQDDQSLSAAQLSAAFAPTIRAVKATGANSVSLCFNIFQSNIHSNRVMAGPGTPSPSRLRIFIDVARAANLRVLVRPLLDETSLRPAWRGVIAPTSPVVWLRNYSSFLIPYLDVARMHGVAIFQIANELNSMARQPQWRDVIRQAHRHFPRELQFTSGMYPATMVAPRGTSFGIDFYHPIVARGSASIAMITQAMQGVLQRFPGPRTLAQTTLTEVGIRSQVGAYAKPSAAQLSGPPTPQRLNSTIQRRWFTAACNIAHNNGMRGIFFWALSFPGPAFPSPNVAYPTRFSRPGLVAIQRCFARTYPRG
jgi:hypothetical protein